MELNDELFRLTDVATEAIYPDAMIADCYIYLFNLANKVSFLNLDPALIINTRHTCAGGFGIYLSCVYLSVC